MKITRLLLLLTLSVSTLYAEAPKPAPAPAAKEVTAPAPATLTEEAKATLLSDLKSVILAQKNVSEKVARFNSEYNKQIAGLPKGSSINVNAETDTVDVVLPAPEKPADKK